MKKFITTWFYAAIGTVKETRRAGFFGTRMETSEVQNPRLADYDSFAALLEDAYNSFDQQGYDVVNIVPLVLGNEDDVHAVLKDSGRPTFVGKVGYSVTRGAVVVGKLREAQG